MEGEYLVVGGTIDSTEDELDCWSEEFESLESVRKAMKESVPVRDADGAVSPGYFVRVDQWDDELGGWQPCEAERGHTWTVLGFGGMRPDKGLSDGFEVIGPGPDRALCPDFDLLAEAVALVEGSGTYRTRWDVPEGYAAWRAHDGWVGVRPLWGEGPHARSNSRRKIVGQGHKLRGAVEAPWAACGQAMRVDDGVRELADLGLRAGNIYQALAGSKKRGSGLVKVGYGLYRYMP